MTGLTQAGTERKQFSIPLSLVGAVETSQFIGRGNELQQIHKSLAGDGSRHTVVLQALGGMGKTQLALAYARRYRNDYSAVFWFNIQDEVLLKQSFVKAAKRILQYHPSALRLVGLDLTGNLDSVVESVNAWLGELDNTRWLAIFDNYDNPKLRDVEDPAAVDIRRYLPEADQGSVIITTRSARVTIGEFMSIPKLAIREESVDILSSMSRRELSLEGKLACDSSRQL